MQKRPILLVACFLFYIACAAQQYPFVHYTPRDGLVNSRVRKAFQDSKGRMYFLTYGGLSIYNGTKFKNYTTQNGLLNDLVNDALELGPDSILISTNTHGLNILVKGEMKKYPLIGNEPPVVNQFLRDSTGTIFMSTDGGLYRLLQNRFEILSTSWAGQMQEYLGRMTLHKNYLIFTTNNLRGNAGLYLYNIETNRVTDALPGVLITDLVSDPAEKVWIGTDKYIKNLESSALEAGKLQLINLYDNHTNIENHSPGTVHFNKQNELLIFEGRKGMTLYNKAGSEIHIVSPDSTTMAAQSVFLDREDVLWVFQDGNGVYKLSNTKLQTKVDYIKENRSGISRVITISRDSTIFMMRDGHWILQTVSGNISFTLYPATIFLPMQFSQTQVIAIDEHSLYAGAVPKQALHVLQLRKIFTGAGSFASKSVRDPNGNMIFFETNHVFVFQKDKLLFSYPWTSIDLVEGAYITKTGELWLVSRVTGLQIFTIHPEDTSNYLRHRKNFRAEFENASPRCILVDENELLWVGTRYRGLIAFQLRNGRLEKKYHFQAHTGLTDNFITSIAFDNAGNIIIGSQSGVDRLVKTASGEFRPENITRSNNIFNYVSAVWTDANNNAFALTTAENILQISPVLKTANPVEPQLLIEEIKINGQPIIQRGIAALRFAHYQRNIIFSAAAPSFLDEKQVQYSYRLNSGDDNDWSEPGTNADINLANLRPGKYTLDIKAIFPSTLYEPKQTSISFEILPPWWQTWWFRLAAGLIIIGLLMTGIRSYYRRKLEKQKSILEKQKAIEEERSRIAADMHDDLGAGLTKIKYITENILEKTGREEALHPELQKLNRFSSELVESMGEIIWAVSEKNNLMSYTLYYLRSYAMNYCEENNLDCYVELPQNFTDSVVSGNLRRNIFLLLKESLHNIVKHAAAKTVNISVSIKEGMELIIHDDGKGFGENRNIFTGNGLINMKKRVKELKGSIRFENDRGTTVIIQIPLSTNQSTIV